MSLEVRIVKRYPGFQLKADFDCGLETMALLGASGSGKTMTLNCIAGVVKPDEGRIALDGRVLFDSSARINLTPQQRGVGLLFQSYALFPNMTAEQNILCGLTRVRGRGEKARRLCELTERLRLQGLEKHYPAQLSGGQQQRVALARLLASDPGLLMLDEPFAALDEALKWELEQELMEMLERVQKPALYITHDMREVRRLCARVCVLDAGRTQRPVTTGELLERPRTMAAARLSGCENVAFARQEDRQSVYVGDWDAVLRLSGPPAGSLRAVAVRADRIKTGNQQNALLCDVLRVMEDAGRAVAVCRPVGARGSLCMAWRHGAEAPCSVGQRVSLSIAPEYVQPLV